MHPMASLDVNDLHSGHLSISVAFFSRYTCGSDNVTLFSQHERFDVCGRRQQRNIRLLTGSPMTTCKARIGLTIVTDAK
jgi:hypothetical protein